MNAVFISYRRSDSSDITGRICDRLKVRFGEAALFKDVDSIPIGLDFRAVISEAVGKCNVLLAIIGDDWLGAVDASGGRRIDDPNDYVHLEIASALKRGIPVVPILVEGAAMPRQDELPGPLKELSFRNGIPVRPDPDFHNDMDRLCQQLVEHVEAGRWRRYLRPADPRVRRGLPWAVAAVAAPLLIALAIPKRNEGPIDAVLRVEPGDEQRSRGDGDPPREAHVPIRYWIDDLPEVPGEDAARLFTNALGAWGAEAGIAMRRADSPEGANVRIRTMPGLGTVANVGPPRAGGPPLVITFDAGVPWTRATFESLSARMIGHVLGLTTTETPGQLMSDASTGASYGNLPPVPQPEDIARARQIWDGVP